MWIARAYKRSQLLGPIWKSTAQGGLSNCPLLIASVEVLEKTYRAGPEFSRAGAVAYAEAVANPPGLEEAYLKTFAIEQIVRLTGCHDFATLTEGATSCFHTI